ncbi:MAG TPA: MoxR family ATPase [Ramlibacter sp.]|nr:MoxR family ATPase [Ramlibacter sp.]
MKISALIETIKSQYRQPPERRRPIFAQGVPGVGKSQAAETAAADLGIGFMSLQATIEDPITLSGLPARDVYVDGMQSVPTNEAVFLPFRDKLPSRGEGVLCIDEINTAAPMVQAGLYDLFLHGKLGSYRLPTGWYVMATGNRDEDRAATQRIPMPLIGRWTRVVVEVDLADWTKWALVNAIRTEMIAFFQFRPELFHTFDPKKAEPYCCPRTAVFASHIIDSAPPGLEHELLCGTIGEGVATELVAFMRVFREMISPDAILLNPATAPVPTEPAAACAIAAALAHKATESNFGRVLTYANRMPAEYGVLIVKLATHRDIRLNATRAFIEWAAANTDVVL